MTLRADQMNRLMAIGLAPLQLKAVMEIVCEPASATLRQRRWRAKQVSTVDASTVDTISSTVDAKPSTGDVIVDVLPSSSPSYSRETYKKQNKTVVAREPEVFPTKSDLAEAADDWNTIAELKDLAQIRMPISGNRSRQLKARLCEFGSIDAWDNYLIKVRDSPFLCGDNDRQWRISFDDALQPRFVTKVMEGAYDQKKQAHNGNGRGHAAGNGRSYG